MRRIDRGLGVLLVVLLLAACGTTSKAGDRRDSSPAVTAPRATTGSAPSSWSGWWLGAGRGDQSLTMSLDLVQAGNSLSGSAYVGPAFYEGAVGGCNSNDQIPPQLDLGSGRGTATVSGKVHSGTAVLTLNEGGGNSASVTARFQDVMIPGAVKTEAMVVYFADGTQSTLVKATAGEVHYSDSKSESCGS